MTEKKKQKRISGVVVSTKMKDTAVVLVQSYEKHPKYQKYIKRSKKYKVHDLGNSVKDGDKVEFVQTKPISKTKKFKIVK